MIIFNNFSKFNIVWLYNVLMTFDISFLINSHYSFFYLYFFNFINIQRYVFFKKIIKIKINELLFNFSIIYKKQILIKKKKELFIFINKITKFDSLPFFLKKYFSYFYFLNYFKFVYFYFFILSFTFYEKFENLFLLYETIGFNITIFSKKRNFFLILNLLFYKEYKLKKMSPYITMWSGQFLKIFQYKKSLKTNIFFRSVILKQLRRIFLILQILNADLTVKGYLRNFKFYLNNLNSPLEEIFTDPFSLKKIVDTTKKLIINPLLKNKENTNYQYQYDFFINFNLFNVKLIKFNKSQKAKKFKSIKKKLVKKIVKFSQRRF
jgi:hypothetical protein